MFWHVLQREIELMVRYFAQKVNFGRRIEGGKERNLRRHSNAVGRERNKMHAKNVCVRSFFSLKRLILQWHKSQGASQTLTATHLGQLRWQRAGIVCVPHPPSLAFWPKNMQCSRVVGSVNYQNGKKYGSFPFIVFCRF